MAYFYLKSLDLFRKVVDCKMSYPIKDEEKSTLLNWLHLFGSRFEIGFIVTDPSKGDDEIVFVNTTFTKITGYSFEEVGGKNLRFLQGKDTDMELIRDIDQRLHDAHPVNVELLNYKKDGTPFWNELVIQPIVDEYGKVLFNASFLIDVTNRKKDELLLKFQKKIFMGINEGLNVDGLMENISDVVETSLPTGAACTVLFKDQNEKWTIQAKETIPTQLILKLRHAVEHDADSMDRNKLIVNEIQSSDMHEFKSSWSLAIVDNDGSLNGILIIFLRAVGPPSDTQLRFLKKLTPVIQLTKTFFDQQERYRWLAYSDPETGLPNRYAFLERLNKEIENGGTYFVATVQPYEYNKVIDLYGRDAAAELFIQLAKRIEKIGREKANYVGKSSSSSLVLTSELSGSGNGKYYVLQLKKITSEPFIVAGQEMFITLKIGISLSRGEGYSAEELHRRADVALTYAKRRSGNAVSFYRDLQQEETAQEMTIFNELTKALAADEIDVYYQPKVNLETREIIGFEALARWSSPLLGHVPPDVFIPIAESTGKIIELEIGILTKVINWQNQQVGMGNKIYQVAVNISVDHFFDESFVELLNELVDRYNVNPNCVRLEITESIGLVDFERAKLIFNELHKKGFEVSIDDFGVGYSSLSYLPQLKVSELKIDRSFISALDRQDTRAVVMTIIQLADNLNLTVVAEGIEKEEQIETLRSFGCRIGQGYYFYKPMPLHEINDLLQEKKK